MEIATEEQSSSSLMLAYAGGDIDAFLALYLKHKGPLFRFILRQGFPHSRTDELFQEIWLKVIKAKGQYQQQARFQTWLYRIARNHLIDDFRKQGKHLEQEYIDETIDDEAVTNIETHIDGERLKQQILSSVSALPFEQRQAFILKHEVGLNNEAIAVDQSATTMQEQHENVLKGHFSRIPWNTLLSVAAAALLTISFVSQYNPWQEPSPEFEGLQTAKPSVNEQDLLRKKSKKSD